MQVRFYRFKRLVCLWHLMLNSVGPSERARWLRDRNLAGVHGNHTCDIEAIGVMIMIPCEHDIRPTCTHQRQNKHPAPLTQRSVQSHKMQTYKELQSTKAKQGFSRV